MERSQSDEDAQREICIDQLTMRLHTEKSPTLRRQIWSDLKQAVKSRSAAQIERMEREKGLRR